MPRRAWRSVYRVCITLADVICGWWKDSTFVCFASYGWPWRAGKHVVMRKQRGQKEPVPVSASLIAEIYNKFMGAVDYFNREALTVYRGQLRSTRVWRHVFFTLLQMWVHVSYCLYVFAKHRTFDADGSPGFKKMGVSGNKEFRLGLADELAAEHRAAYARSRRWRTRKLTPLSTVGLTVEAFCEHAPFPVKGMKKYKGTRAECAWCRATMS